MLRPVVGCTCPARATGPCASCGVQGPGWCARGLWARGLRPQHDNTTKLRPVVARAPNGYRRGLVLGFTFKGPRGHPGAGARCWLRVGGPPQAFLAGGRGGAVRSALVYICGAQAPPPAGRVLLHAHVRCQEALCINSISGALCLQFRELDITIFRPFHDGCGLSRGNRVLTRHLGVDGLLLSSI